MKKIFSFTIALSFLVCWNVTGQVRRITGLVSINNERQSGAVIRNTSRRIQVTSNDIGEFSITAETGDTLITSKGDYMKDTLTVTNEPYFIILLKKSPTMLKEVTVNATALTPAKKLEENKKDYHEIYRIGDKSHMIVGLGINVDKLWSAISREGNNARKLQRRFNTDYKSSIVDRRFNKALVGHITGYKGERLANFMDKCRPSFETVKKDTDYELIQYIKKKMAEDKQTS